MNERKIARRTRLSITRSAPGPAGGERPPGRGDPHRGRSHHGHSRRGHSRSRRYGSRRDRSRRGDIEQRKEAQDRGRQHRAAGSGKGAAQQAMFHGAPRGGSPLRGRNRRTREETGTIRQNMARSAACSRRSRRAPVSRPYDCPDRLLPDTPGIALCHRVRRQPDGQVWRQLDLRSWRRLRSMLVRYSISRAVRLASSNSRLGTTTTSKPGAIL